jgi:hypothetical protein
MAKIVCRPKVLTPTQAALARRRSVEVNPANVDLQRIVERTPVGRRGGPRRLAVSVGHRWPATGVDLSVQFLDTPSRELRARILLHMNAWSSTANVRFRETAGVGEVRIARLDDPPDLSGYWSYLGTEILGIEDDQPTLNLEGFTMRTSEAEFRRVVRHEAGHTLGFEHEHMRAELIKRIDPNKAVAYYDRTEGWTRAETLEQVLKPLSARSIMGTTEADPVSIMCYQIPGGITKDGTAIPGGVDINDNDYAFAAKLYPKPRAAPADAPRDAAPPQRAAPPARQTRDAGFDDDTFHIIVMDRFQEDVSAGRTAPRPEFVRVLASYAGARVTVPMRVRRSDDGAHATRFGEIIETHERIKSYTNRDSGSLPDDEAMLRFGDALFETLFQGDVRRLYDEARARQHGRKLDLVFTSMVPWIAEKPWEFAYDKARNSFLATEDIHFIRNVLTSVPADASEPLTAPLRILVASAQPVGFGLLSIDQETEVIRRGFEPLVAAGLVQIEVLPRATPADLHAKLSTGTYPIVHFIGHGVFDEDTRKGALIFEDERGGESRLGERSVREIFCQRGVRLVFLNACQSGAGSRADFNKGIAQSLVAHGVPALVANQYSVLDVSATRFAQHFYWALSQGCGIGRAAREARISVNYSLQGDSIDWAVPVVYARDPAMTLCEKPDVAAPAPSRAPAGQERRSAGRPYEIAVWDIDSVFPKLADTLEKFNRAQTHFGFSLTDLSAPVDAWDLEDASAGGVPTLRAEHFAHRLARMPAELRVNAIACVTRHPMRDGEGNAINAWWPWPGQPGVLIFSCAAFPQLEPEGAATEHVIANVLVGALAGFLGDVDTHDKPRDCPLSHNVSLDFKRLTRPLAFHKKCRDQLAKTIPTELAALEALL